MMLLDKGFFDYDYEKTDAPVIYKEKSSEELKGILSGFGFTQFADKKPESLEEKQEYILKQMEEK